MWWTISLLTALTLSISGLFLLNTAPMRAFGGIVWLNKGPRFLSNSEVEDRIKKLNTPYEIKIAETINKKTISCKEVENGFCKRSNNDFVFKTTVSPAVAYQPKIPDKKEIIGYCTLCNDGTFSPSCAVGRGACSWHGGVASYNVPEYVTTPGKPEVKAKPAQYDYAPRTYKSSPLYKPPEAPSLTSIVNM
jgi:hypothetical protein